MRQDFHSEITSLLALSARLGRDPLLVQASSGNTSIKLDRTMWIKASGKWLADAECQEILVPVDLADARERVRRNVEPCTAPGAPSGLRASIETSMHAVLPHRVVLHVHSANTIAWAVRKDGPARIAEKLQGLAWRWIPYSASGLALARAIEDALREEPRTDILVLGNHGLVVCGESCAGAETLLREVERRLAGVPRHAPGAQGAKTVLLRRIAEVSEWRIPDNEDLHLLALDPISRGILKNGILFPCQAIFLGPETPMLPAAAPFSEAARSLEGLDGWQTFLILEGGGVMVSSRLTRAENAVLEGLMNVVQRIAAEAPIRYLEAPEVRNVLSVDAHRYRELAEPANVASLSYVS